MKKYQILYQTWRPAVPDPPYISPRPSGSRLQTHSTIQSHLETATALADQGEPELKKMNMLQMHIFCKIINFHQVNNDM